MQEEAQIYNNSKWKNEYRLARIAKEDLEYLKLYLDQQRDEKGIYLLSDTKGILLMHDIKKAEP